MPKLIPALPKGWKTYDTRVLESLREQAEKQADRENAHRYAHWAASAEYRRLGFPTYAEHSERLGRQAGEKAAAYTRQAAALRREINKRPKV